MNETWKSNLKHKTSEFWVGHCEKDQQSATNGPRLSPKHVSGLGVPFPGIFQIVGPQQPVQEEI